MNITLTSLEALILKATHESLPCPDAAAVEAFCAIMNDCAEGAQLAAQALSLRIHSSNSREALLALTMLDQCMRRSDTALETEVGKFRFLNEMIKLVSPKYFADRTPLEVRTRVLQLFHAWSIEYPKEIKFKVAYDMLRNQGVIKETPPPLPPENAPATRARAKSAVFEDEEKSKLLQKLLQSKKPEDLQHANRLIKTMVREEERRNEVNSRRSQEIFAAMDSAGLLLDMLEHAADATPDEEQLIQELYELSKRQRVTLNQFAGEDGPDDSVEEIIRVSNVLDEVTSKYVTFIARKKILPKSTAATSISTNGKADNALLDFAGGDSAGTEAGDSTSNAMDVLGDIFSTASVAEPLIPVSLLPKEDVSLLGEQPGKAEGWNELDSLGELLLKQSLPDNARRADGFTSKSTKKIPMNALEKSSPKHEVQPSSILDLDFFTQPAPRPDTDQPITSATDDLMVDITTDHTNSNNNSPVDTILDLTTTAETAKSNEKEKRDIKSLADINVTLDSVKPSKMPPLTVFEEEDGISVVLHFCKGRPRPDVNVIVVSTTSKKSTPVEDYKFQAVVPKDCKARLLTSSGTCLPACNPFLPPPALTQVMLLATPPTYTVVHLKFVITYSCDDELFSEIGEVRELPLTAD